MQYSLINGHILFGISGYKLLLDTGAPVSFGDIASIKICGREYPLPNSFMGHGMESLQPLIPQRVDALIGMDILHHYTMVIDSRLFTIDFFEGTLPMVGDIVRIDTTMAGIFIDLLINGQTTKLIFDTGAMLSYLYPQITRGLNTEGTKDDFHPMIGHFSTDLYKVNLSLCDRDFVLQVGNLPEPLLSMITKMGSDGIIGSSLFDFVSATFSFPTNQAAFRMND